LGNRYVDELLAGNIVLAQAWSGDVLGLLVPEQTEAQDFRFALPAEGGMLWTDNMGIPKGALGKADAEAWIDYYYRPEVAAEIEAFVNYVCPVKGAAEVLLATDPDTASNPLIFPTQEMRDRLHEFVSVDPATRQAWEEAFSTAVGL
jgi:spermidine/putrescine transport system substrate-binding protein